MYTVVITQETWLVIVKLTFGENNMGQLIVYYLMQWNNICFLPIADKNPVT